MPSSQSSLSALVFLLVLALAGASMPLGAAQRFRRGDSNADGVLNMADAIHSLRFLFLGTPHRISCEDAADANDDGDLDVADPVRSLVFLFFGTPAPPPPFGAADSDCGEDPSADALDCDGFSPCRTPGVPPADLFPHRLYAMGSRPESVASGDLDGDGDADLAVTSLLYSTVSVLRNQSVR